jgi:hypothetical protein
MATTTITTTRKPSRTSDSCSCSCTRNKIVRIRVTKETADRLRLLAHDGEEGWNGIIRRLMRTYYEEDKNNVMAETKRFYLKPD